MPPDFAKVGGAKGYFMYLLWVCLLLKYYNWHCNPFSIKHSTWLFDCIVKYHSIRI